MRNQKYLKGPKCIIDIGEWEGNVQMGRESRGREGKRKEERDKKKGIEGKNGNEVFVNKEVKS